MDVTNGMVLNSEENAIQILEELEKEHIPVLMTFSGTSPYYFFDVRTGVIYSDCKVSFSQMTVDMTSFLEFTIANAMSQSVSECVCLHTRTC